MRYHAQFILLKRDWVQVKTELVWVWWLTIVAPELEKVIEENMSPRLAGLEVTVSLECVSN